MGVLRIFEGPAEDGTMPAATVTDVTFDVDVRQATGLVIVYFWAPWCAPCKRISPMIDQLAETEVRARFVKVNADESPAVTIRYGVMKMPTIMVFQDGRLVDAMTNGVTASTLRRRLVQWLG